MNVNLKSLIGKMNNILSQVQLHIVNQVAHTFAPMIAGDFVMQIAEAALDRVGAGTIGGQEQQLKAGMLPEPVLDRSGFMNFAVVCHDIDPVKAPGRIGTVEDVNKSRNSPVIFRN
jgi:hypothetical protein